ncbi:histidine phosphatase family protein [Streptomyces sp. NPDC001985]|uniref:histidine phosphatase family protein n=1 Tax=Streptomyces sp. NPDC001985 TaxID=3154406 RepID=UPI0033223CF3
MTVRMMMVAPVATEALREARFEAGEPPDEAGLVSARAAAGGLPRADRAVSGPSPRCRLTARALGLAAREAPELGEWDMGRWRGRSLAEVSRDEPDAVGHWLTDPSAAPHGGEALTALCARVGGWLDALPPDTGRLVAVVDPAVARAALVHALGLPLPVFWRLDIAPLTLTELSSRAGRWNLRCGTRLLREP